MLTTCFYDFECAMLIFRRFVLYVLVNVSEFKVKIYETWITLTRAADLNYLRMTD